MIPAGRLGRAARRRRTYRTFALFTPCCAGCSSYIMVIVIGGIQWGRGIAVSSQQRRKLLSDSKVTG